MTSPPRLFLSRAGRQGEDESDALESGLAIVGFRKVGSLEGATTREEIKASVKEGFPEKSPNAIGNFAGQLNNFINLESHDSQGEQFKSKNGMSKSKDSASSKSAQR